MQSWKSNCMNIAPLDYIVNFVWFIILGCYHSSPLEVWNVIVEFIIDYSHSYGVNLSSTMFTLHSLRLRCKFVIKNVYHHALCGVNYVIMNLLWLLLFHLISPWKFTTLGNVKWKMRFVVNNWLMPLPLDHEDCMTWHDDVFCY